MKKEKFDAELLAAGKCALRFEGGNACRLDLDHEGLHKSSTHGWKARRPKPELAADKPAPAPAAAPEECEAIALHDDEWVCALRTGHPGPHRSERVPGGTQATWTTNDDGSERGERRQVSAAGKVMSSVTDGSGGWSSPSKADSEAARKRVDERIDAEVAQEFEDAVQNEIAKPSRAEDRFRAGEAVGGTELLAAREAKRRKKEAKPTEPTKTDGPNATAATAPEPPAAKHSAVRLTDKCWKCKREFGEHDGKKCPEPEPTVGKLTKIGNHEVHAAAALFPMIGDAEWPSFVDDIRTNGQRKKIVRIRVGPSWLILDGRNRLRACLELKIEPEFRIFGEETSDGADPIAFVVSENVHRRHLNETQRAFVGAELVPMYEAHAKERQRAAGGDKRSGERPLTLNSGQAVRSPTAAEQAARAVNVGKASIEAALKVNRDAAPEVIAAAKERGQMKVSAAAELATLPKKQQREIVEKVGSGEIRSGKVRSLVKQEKKRAVVREINEQRVAPAPMGPFGVIVIDPPWPYENSDQHEGSRGHVDYPTMTIEQLCAMRAELDARAKDDCLLGLWITNAFVHEIGRLLEAWGFAHQTMITWDKELAGVGSLPRGQTEHLVVAMRGAPVHTLNEVTTLLRVKRREHSRKPDEMYELLAKHCSGPMIDMFSREPREGWATWGAETEKFATEAA